MMITVACSFCWLPLCYSCCSVENYLNIGRSILNVPANVNWITVRLATTEVAHGQRDVLVYFLTEALVIVSHGAMAPVQLTRSTPNVLAQVGETCMCLCVCCRVDVLVSCLCQRAPSSVISLLFLL